MTPGKIASFLSRFWLSYLCSTKLRTMFWGKRFSSLRSSHLFNVFRTLGLSQQSLTHSTARLIRNNFAFLLCPNLFTLLRRDCLSFVSGSDFLTPFSRMRSTEEVILFADHPRSNLGTNLWWGNATPLTFAAISQIGEDSIWTFITSSIRFDQHALVLKSLILALKRTLDPHTRFKSVRENLIDHVVLERVRSTIIGLHVSVVAIAGALSHVKGLIRSGINQHVNVKHLVIPTSILIYGGM
jgi:hypothetical protein